MIQKLPSRPSEAELNASIDSSLNQFSTLIGLYGFGSTLANQGQSNEKGLLAKRPSYMRSVTQNRQIPFGPISNSLAMVENASEGDESEVDITDLQDSSPSRIMNSLIWNSGKASQKEFDGKLVL